MAKPVSSLDKIYATLPSDQEAAPSVQKADSLNKVYVALRSAQEAVRIEIAARIAAGEQIGSMSDADMQERSEAALDQKRAERTPKKSAA